MTNDERLTALGDTLGSDVCGCTRVMLRELRAVTVDTSRRISGGMLIEQVPVTYEWTDGSVSEVWMTTYAAVAEVIAHSERA